VPPADEAPHAVIDPSFAATKTDGSIKAWGDRLYGGANAPSGNGYTKIYSTISASILWVTPRHD
jgi:hypothetical protein